MCGLAAMAGASMVLNIFDHGGTVMDHAPPLDDVVLARVPGHGTAHALVAHSPDGPVLGYEGEGFPGRSGFGVVLVDDSTDAVRGAIVFDADPPPGRPQVGSIADDRIVLPLHAMRVRWASVSDPKCPLFWPRDLEALTR